MLSFWFLYVGMGIKALTCCWRRHWSKSLPQKRTNQWFGISNDFICIVVFRALFNYDHLTKTKPRESLPPSANLKPSHASDRPSDPHLRHRRLPTRPNSTHATYLLGYQLAREPTVGQRGGQELLATGPFWFVWVRSGAGNSLGLGIQVNQPHQKSGEEIGVHISGRF